MLMFLAILAASMIVLVLSFVAFANSGMQEDKPSQLPSNPPADSPRFFVAATIRESAASIPPVGELLGQIERHIRREQEAAESFLVLPSVEVLHAHSTSNFLS